MLDDKAGAITEAKYKQKRSAVCLSHQNHLSYPKRPWKTMICMVFGNTSSVISLTH